MITSAKPRISDTSQSTIDPLHHAHASAPRDARATRAPLATHVVPARVHLSTFVASASLSLPPLSRVFGADPGDAAFRERTERPSRAPDRVDASLTSTTDRRERARGDAEKYHAPVASPVASIARSRRRLLRHGSIARRHGDRPFNDFLGCNHSLRGRARGRHTRVDGGERFEAKRSEGVGRRRARGGGNAGRAPGDGLGRARDVGVAR